LRVEAHAERVSSKPRTGDLPTIWISDLKIEAEVH
jgi:hypothetical protein